MINFKKIMAAAVLLFAAGAAAMFPAAALPALAQTGISSTSSYNDLPVNHVNVDVLSLSNAEFSTTNSEIQFKTNWQSADSSGGGVTNAVVYDGVPEWGTANTTSSANAKTAQTQVSGSFTLRWNKAATLPDGTKADVQYTFSNWVINLGERPDNVSASALVYVPILTGTSRVSYVTYNPRRSVANTSGVATTVRQRINTTVQILKSGTNEPIDSKYDCVMVRFLDLDVIDHGIATGSSAADRYAGTYSEGIGFVSGWKSPIYRSSATSTVIDTVGGNQKVRGTMAADGTITSGFIGAAAPQGYSYIWYGSYTATGAPDGTCMATGISKAPEVSVYATAGKGGSIEKPGATNYALNTKTTYDYTPERGYKVKSLKVNDASVPFDDDGGTYTFEKLIERSSSYDHTIDVQFAGPMVTYEWKGDHPDKKVPDGGEVEPGEYTVDTSYKKGDTVREENTEAGGRTYPRGTWTFGGWDKDPVIEIYEDTKIIGEWSFDPDWVITASAENGTIEGAEEGIPSGESRTVTYEPDDGYQLKTLTIDGEGADIEAYPESYTFTDIDGDHDVKAVFEKIPRLSIEKKSDKEHCNAGDTVTYTVKVSQTVEGAEARDVIITDSIPEGMTLIEGSLKGDGMTVEEESERAYTVSYKTLGEAEYTYKCRTEESVDAHDLINTVAAGGSNVPEQATDDNTVDSHVPEVTIEKEVDKSEALPGDGLSYTIKVRQTHEGAELRNAVFTDEIPEGITVDEESISVTGDDAAEISFEDGVISMETESLKSGFDISFDAVIDDDFEGTIVNTGVVDGYITEEQKLPEPIEDSAQTVSALPQEEPAAAPVDDGNKQEPKAKPDPVRTGDESSPAAAAAACALAAFAAAAVLYAGRKRKKKRGGAS